MQINLTRHPTRILLPLLLILSAGCEGAARRHDDRVADINPPPEEFHAVAREDLPNFPDLVEDMVAGRKAFIQQLIALERRPRSLPRESTEPTRDPRVGVKPGWYGRLGRRFWGQTWPLPIRA